jgi:enoyl-CoA hydratase/carnithine racemase
VTGSSKSSDADGLVLFTCERGLATITMNRPDKHNALNDEMSHLFRDIFSGALEDPQVRCILLRANGPSFSSGRDTTQLGQRQPGDTDWEFVRRHQLIRTQKVESPKPVVAAIKGFTFGGAFELALSADIRVADHTLQASLPEVRYAIAVDTGASALVTALAGPSKAKYLMMTGDRIDASTALAWGLVDFLVAPDELDAKALGIAERIAANAPLAVQMSKALVDSVWAGALHAALRSELLAQTALFASRDRVELGDARREGRDPNFQGR